MPFKPSLEQHFFLILAKSKPMSIHLGRTPPGTCNSKHENFKFYIFLCRYNSLIRLMSILTNCVHEIG